MTGVTVSGDAYRIPNRFCKNIFNNSIESPTQEDELQRLVESWRRKEQEEKEIKLRQQGRKYMCCL